MISKILIEGNSQSVITHNLWKDGLPQVDCPGPLESCGDRSTESPINLRTIQSHGLKGAASNIYVESLFPS